MTEQDVYDGLTEIVRDLFDDDSIHLTAATTANDIDGWDSFNHLNIIAAAELRFGVKFQTKEYEGIRDVGALVQMIMRKQG